MKNTCEENGYSRRFVLKAAFRGSCYGVAYAALPVMALAGDVQMVEHPLKKPANYTSKGPCPNCGMNLNMWARTRHEFSNSEGQFTVCSIRCLADMSEKSDEKAKNVTVADYLHPEKMLAAEQVEYLVGSTAKGTMTMKSKIAFPSKKVAKEFAAVAGGTLVDFNAALAMASKELSASKPKIEAKRKKKGKIEEPGQDARCVVCGMYPARYPEHRCQVSTTDGKHYHFCSTHCLVDFQASPKEYIKDVPKITSVWVTLFPDGGSEYAMGLYYLVGSSLMGPMGPEAIPYRHKATAVQNATKNGGKVVRFKELRPALLSTKSTK